MLKLNTHRQNLFLLFLLLIHNAKKNIYNHVRDSSESVFNSF